LLGAVSAISLGAFACSVGKGSSFDGDGDDAGGNGQGGTGNMGGAFNPTSSGGSGAGSNNCTLQDSMDHDGDGTSFVDGDCNDCDPNVNQAAIEVATDSSDPEAVASDENCDGQVDEAVPTCDSGLTVADTNAVNAAAALDICGDANSGPWGVVSASWVRAQGGVPATPGQATGLLPTFGANGPRNGDALLVISSGYARDENAADPCGTMSCQTTGAGQPPAGFPQGVVGCEGGTDINDDIALEVNLKAPSNAIGYSFDFAFMSFEFPEWVCTDYNDQFVALVDPAPMDAINGNISFDSQTNPVSVNVAYFDNCDPAGQSQFGSMCQLFGSNCPTAPSPYCPLGPAFMNGTGFNTWGDSGSTGWLVTTAPVEGGESFRIRFAIWDTGDANLDSTVMLDNFKWIAEGGTVEVGTLPVPE
jgi:hypothetical protein